MIENVSNGRFRLWLQRMPEKPRMTLVAIIGGAIGLVVYEIIYFLNPIVPRATTSWLISFLIGVPRQHALHRWLTFGDRTPYWSSLKRAYVLYTTLVVLTTVINYLLVESLHWHHRLAWLTCITTAGAINLIVLKRVVYYHSHRNG